MADATGGAVTRARSSLEVFDVATGAVGVVLRTERLIEAPNWTRDGRALIVNGDGLLWRVPLDAPALLPIDTGFARACNNDHGVSPDGRWLAVTDKTETGQSCIYVLPVGGGEPRRVTPRVPSYWHGWSPDGSTLAFCAKRPTRWAPDTFGVATIPVEGGEERWLVEGPGHSDGPDYSPDGEWIWFNSSNDGAMQLWRVRPDGSNAERMTDDGRVNWFPHPSPDGRHVLYLSYPPGTDGHPRDLDVELRLLDLADRSARTLLPLFGGQGTINVPCWHPDGGRFAFMRFFPEDADG